MIGDPLSLVANAGKSFQGSVLCGIGFVLDTSEATTLLNRNKSNAQVILPVLNGQDLNGNLNQAPSRYAINFFDWPLSRQVAPATYSGPVAEDFPDCISIVEERVKPERTRTRKMPSGEEVFVLRKPLPQKWWIYADKRPALYAAISSLTRVITVAATSRTLAFAFCPKGIVYSHAVYVFAFDTAEHLALLQSAFHEAWARRYASSMKNDLRYTPSDCFDNFPFPNRLDSVRSHGTRYDEHRCNVMKAKAAGLTATYNRFHDPDETSADIQKLRDLHADMDQAVAAAYGWTDLDLAHGFHETKQGVRFTISEPARREVLQRLLKLNHERYAEEVKQGLHTKKGDTKKAPAERKPKKPAPKPVFATQTLLALDDDDDSFPNSERDSFLCGLVCDLVAAEPGLLPNEYLDELVAAIGAQRHKRLLSGKERTRIAKLCKAIPAASGTQAKTIPWNRLQSVLELRDAVIPDSNARLQVGPKFQAVRTTYPACDPEMVTLIRKAAAELRDLLAQVQPATPEMDAVLQDFKSDRQQLCGVLS